MIKRKLSLPANPKESFFLWGPRQSGKSMLLKTDYPNAVWYDLLKTDLYIRLLEKPSILREELLFASAQSKGKAGFVVIDEIQKIPALLDEVHWLIENAALVFGLCGSSARKVRRGHANLLGGRAVRYELFGFVSGEIGPEFDLVRMINHGYLPRHYLSPSPQRLIRSYVNDYLKEEIAAEALVRNLPAFSSFLSAAALSDTELVNYATIARECGISAPAVKEYFQILIDTMLGRFLEAWRKRPKRRVIGAPKFYFSDVGVVNCLAKRGEIAPGAELFGKAFENWVFHELCAHRSYSEMDYSLSYWRLASGIEVDFIVGDMELAIEAKSSSRITSDHLRGLREIIKDHPRLKRRVIVSLEERPRRTEDGIEILPHSVFTKQLWSDELVEKI
ncbi:MAG: ATP-binding protein [Candidatus Omnitrophica bacterium]|nr:ATP-binding protein [Candidatus Omnitrophota bacterium]